MSQEKRKYARREAYFEVELGIPSGETHVVHTRDISEGGVFLLLGDTQRPIIGEVVTVKIHEEAQSKGETFPSGDAVVVRQEEEGIGLAFIELELSDDF